VIENQKFFGKFFETKRAQKRNDSALSGGHCICHDAAWDRARPERSGPGGMSIGAFSGGGICGLWAPRLGVASGPHVHGSYSITNSSSSRRGVLQPLMGKPVPALSFLCILFLLLMLCVVLLIHGSLTGIYRSTC
jgi:hypothetical protein